MIQQVCFQPRRLRNFDQSFYRQPTASPFVGDAVGIEFRDRLQRVVVESFGGFVVEVMAEI